MYHVSIFTIYSEKYSLLLQGMLIDVIHTYTYFYAIIDHRIVYGFFHFPDNEKDYTRWVRSVSRGFTFLMASNFTFYSRKCPCLPCFSFVFFSFGV